MNLEQFPPIKEYFGDFERIKEISRNFKKFQKMTQNFHSTDVKAFSQILKFERGF